MTELINSFKIIGVDVAENNEHGPNSEQGESSNQGENRSNSGSPAILSSSLCPEDQTPLNTKRIEDIYEEKEPMEENYHVCLSITEEPSSFQEAYTIAKWRQAIEDEYDSIIIKKT